MKNYTFCVHSRCKFNTTLYNGLRVCGMPVGPRVREWQEDMRPEILICIDFEEGKPTNEDVRDKNGYYPGQLKEPR